MRAEIALHKRAWRAEFGGFLKNAKSELVLACPYIREDEAKFVAGSLSGKIRILALTSLDVNSIINGALEIGGIERLAGFSPDSKAVNLPKLHAKVFVADASNAVVTSSNLTSSGIDRNYEYGVFIKGAKAVSEIRSDLENYKNLGTQIQTSDFRHIENLANSAREIHRKTKLKIERESRELKRAVASLENECLALQIGEKSETKLFSDALRYVLLSGSAKTTEIQTAIRELYPQLCQSSADRVIKGRTFGKLWKHHLRNAQQGMKRRGEIKYDGKSGLWSLI